MMNKLIAEELGVSEIHSQGPSQPRDAKNADSVAGRSGANRRHLGIRRDQPTRS